jgi:hypothetical protein
MHELGAHARQLVRELRDEECEVVLTLDDEPVAILRPYTKEDATADQHANDAATMRAIEALRAEISSVWPAGVRVMDVIEEQRS